MLLALLGLGGTLVVTRTQLPDTSPYVPVMVIAGWACIAVAIVGLAVLFATAQRPADKPRLKAARKCLYKPDMSFFDVSIYVGVDSHWAALAGRKSADKLPSFEEVEAELLEKFSSGRVTVWARLKADSREFQVDRGAWAGANIQLAHGRAFLPSLGVTVCQMRASTVEVGNAWPARTGRSTPTPDQLPYYPGYGQTPLANRSSAHSRFS